MSTRFVIVNSVKDRGGQCTCMNICKLELQAADNSLDFLAGLGFADHDTYPGSCPLCGKPYAFYRLVVSSVANLETPEMRANREAKAARAEKEAREIREREAREEKERNR